MVQMNNSLTSMYPSDLICIDDQTEVRLIFNIEYRILNIRYLLKISIKSIKNFIFFYEFECRSGRFSHLDIEYPPD